MCILKFSLVLFMFGFLFSSCFEKSYESLTSRDIEIFKGTPAWELVNAVNKNNVKKIEKILDVDSTLVDYQEERYGATPLVWAIYSYKYKSAKTLLDYGADPDLGDFDGLTPLIEACYRIYSPSFSKDDPKYIELLLEYEADINKPRFSDNLEIRSPQDNGFTPLMYAAKESYEKTKLLIDRGADLNYSNKFGYNATLTALQNGVLKPDIKIPQLIIVEHKADITQSYITEVPGLGQHEMKLVWELLDWFYELDSEEYLIKMEIVEEFERQGVDYQEIKKTARSTQKYEIMKKHPNNWEEVFEKY